MALYSVTDEDIKQIDKKIQYQKEYQKRYRSNYFTNTENEEDDFLSSVYSANLNPSKYFAEINNRVNSLVRNAKDKGLKAVFLTITAPSKYHKTDRSGKLLISPNQTAKDLTQIFNKFTNLQVFQKLRGSYEISYFRVYEPHKTGVPHLHCIIFLPTSAILNVKKKFYEYFTNSWGANKKALDFRYTWDKSEGGAVAYIMKYILKTFANPNEEETSRAVYWYIKYRIRRFLSSQSLCNLFVYRKVRYYFKNKFHYEMIEIKRLIRDNFIYFSFDKTQICYRYFDQDGVLQDDIIWSKSTECIINSRKYKDNRIHLKYKAPEPLPINSLKVFVDGIHTFYKNKFTQKLTKFRPVLSKLSEYALFMYSQSINRDNEDKNFLYLLDKEVEYRLFGRSVVHEIVL